MSSSLRSRRAAPTKFSDSSSRDRSKTKKSNTKQSSSSSFLSVSTLLCIILVTVILTFLAVDLYSRGNSSVLVSKLNDKRKRSSRRVVEKKKPTSSISSSSFEPALSAEEDAALEYDPQDPTRRYHVIFSTDCSPYQHWQSYLVYYSAMRVRQSGHVVRIASGCTTPEETILIQEWFQQHIQHMSTRFHLHLTPAFSEIKNSQGQLVGDYKFFNKPFGLKHWLEHSDKIHLNDTNNNNDDVVILIDPDMVLLRPLTGDFSNDRETIISDHRKQHLLGSTRVVQQGLPFAQTYGLGTQWRTFDLDKIAGKDSPAKLVSKEDAALYYPVGPPYLATISDMYQIALKWTEFAPRVYEQYPHLLAEMYAFCIAAAHLQLPHTIIDSLMISNTNAGGEGWPLIDQIPSSEMCQYARNMDHSFAVPSVLHMCQRYCVGDDWFFGKRKVPHDLYACEQPLFEEPPDELAVLFDYKRPPNQKERTPLSKQRAAREAFMVCFLTTLVNDAATFFKQTACPLGTANLNKSLKFVDLFTQRATK